MDRLAAMSAFVTVVDEAGFARAARKLKLSPPVITRAVADLERHLGVSLLTRTTRVVRVTDAGARYVEDCRRVLAEIHEAEESAGGAHAAPRGQLNLTAPALFGRIFVTPIVTAYLRRYPDVRADCLFVDRLVNLVEEGIDVAIRIGELPDSSLQGTRVGTVRPVICAAPRYLRAHGIPARPEDLNRHTVVSATAVTPVPQWRLSVGGKEQLFDVKPRLMVSNNDAAIAAALSGFGVVRLLSYQIAAHVKARQLRIVLAEFEPAELPVHVVHHQGRRPSQKVRAFLDMAIDTLRGHPSLTER